MNVHSQRGKQVLFGLFDDSYINAQISSEMEICMPRGLSHPCTFLVGMGEGERRCGRPYIYQELRKMGNYIVGTGILV